MHVIAEVCATPVVVGEDLPLRACLALLRERQVRHLVVESGGRLLGLIHDYQVLRCCTEEDGEPIPRPEHASRTARSLAVTAGLQARPEQPLADVLAILTKGWEDAVVVVDDGRPVGLFTLEDAVMLASSGWLTPWWRVQQAMTRVRWGLHASMPVRLAMRMLWQDRRPHVLVCEGRTAVGAVSLRDLVAVDPRAKAVLGDVLRPEPMTIVAPDTSLLDGALLLLRHRTLCLPVAGAARRPVGIFTAHDILRALRRTVTVAESRAS